MANLTTDPKRTFLTTLNAEAADQQFFSGPISFKIGSKNQFALEIQAGTVAGDLNKPNEDAFAIRFFGNKLAIAVFDGATSLKKIRAHDKIGMSGARFASHFLRDTFLKLPSYSENMLADLNRSLRAEISDFEGMDPDDVTTVPTSTATIVLIDGDADLVSIQHVADSFALARLRKGAAVLLTPDSLAKLEDLIFQRIISTATSLGITNRQARDIPEIRELLINALQEIFNRPDGSGSGVVNGDPAMEQYIYRSSIALSSIDRLLLGSDGLPAPQHPLEKLENCTLLLSLVEKAGIKEAVRFKKEMEDADFNWDTPRWKHSDDASGVFVKIVSVHKVGFPGNQ